VALTLLMLSMSLTLTYLVTSKNMFIELDEQEELVTLVSCCNGDQCFDHGIITATATFVVSVSAV